MAIRKIGTQERLVVFEHEYDDEAPQRLGQTAYLSSGTSCDEEDPPYLAKATYLANPYKYDFYLSDVSTSSSVSVLEKQSLSTPIVADMFFTGRKGSPSTKSSEQAYGIGVTAMSVQTKTKASIVAIADNPTHIDISTILHLDNYMLVIPEIGFIYFCDLDRYSDMEIVEKSPLKSLGIRGVKYQFTSFHITGQLRWDSVSGNIMAEYSLVDELDSQYNYSTSIPFPDSAIPEQDPYTVSSIYRRVTFIDGVVGDDEYLYRNIPMYLANLLYLEYGFVQNILGVWDESSGVTVDDSTIDISSNQLLSGFTLGIFVNGVAPMAMPDRYATLSAFYFGVPYRVSDEVRIEISRSALVSGFSDDHLPLADTAFEGGDKSGASLLILDGFVENMIGGELIIKFAPKVFYPQGPWVNPLTYLGEEDFLMFPQDITIPPRSRLVLSLPVAVGNKVDFSMPGKRVTEMYEIIDGIVTDEVMMNEKLDDSQRGDPTYLMEYVHHAGGGINLHRQVIADMSVYPSRYSYPINNLIRELLSPTTEDADAKKSDARAVFVKFDTRYISDTVSSYYEKFVELPTAFTCDALPEESVLHSDSSKKDTLYRENISSILGDDIVGDGGIARLSFSNTTEEVKSVQISYENRLFPYKSASFDIDDPYLQYKKGWFIHEPHKNKMEGRVKDGVYLNNTTN